MRLLSAGRELIIDNLAIVRRSCICEGAGFELSTEFCRVRFARFCVSAHPCPACGSFDVNRKGKVLKFPTAGCVEPCAQPFRDEARIER